MPRRIGSGHWPAGLVLSRRFPWVSTLGITQRRGRCGAALAGRLPRQCHAKPDAADRMCAPARNIACNSAMAAELYDGGPQGAGGAARSAASEGGNERESAVPSSSRSAEIQIEPDAPRMGARPIANPPPASCAELLAPRRPRDPPFPTALGPGSPPDVFVCAARAYRTVVAPVSARLRDDLRRRGDLRVADGRLRLVHDAHEHRDRRRCGRRLARGQRGHRQGEREGEALHGWSFPR